MLHQQQNQQAGSYPSSPISSPRILPNPSMIPGSTPSSPHPTAHNVSIDPKVAELKAFLNDAPKMIPPAVDKYVLSFQMENGENINCVLWQGKYFITGTDVVKILVYRFHKFGRPVMNIKKFEEGVFSDLRMLKHNNGASLEEPRSPFLEYLYRNNCIRTQKKQKVFYWYSVAHDNLFCDAVERDLKRESNLANINQLMLEQKRHREMLYASQFNPSAAAAFMGYAGMLPPPPTLAPNVPYAMMPHHQLMMSAHHQPQLPPTPIPTVTTQVSATAQDFGAAVGIDPSMIFETNNPQELQAEVPKSSAMAMEGNDMQSTVTADMFPNLDVDPMHFFEQQPSVAEDVISGSDPFFGTEESGSSIPGTDYTIMNDYF